MRNTPWIGAVESPGPGHNGAHSRSAASRSGPALPKNHSPAPSPTAMVEEYRRLTGGEPDRAAVHTGHPQFHCGTPPPAAEPRMRTSISTTADQPLPLARVHRDFHGCFQSFPGRRHPHAAGVRRAVRRRPQRLVSRPLADNATAPIVKSDHLRPPLVGRQLSVPRGRLYPRAHPARPSLRHLYQPHCQPLWSDTGSFTVP